MDILSDQPTQVDPRFADPTFPEDSLPTNHFIFNTSNLFTCGSPVGFFLLLRNATLLPRHDKAKPGTDSSTPGVAGSQGTYGCIPVDNIYNVVNGYDPVAYTLNASLDAAYASTLKPPLIPTATPSLFSLSNPFSRSKPPSYSDPNHDSDRPSTIRLPSTVELETHDFSREEVAEKRAYALNDNGQVDFFLRVGGGVSQYITMLGAHSSYWVNRDFVRFVVVETGRRGGRGGALGEMRARKRGGRGGR